MDVVNNGTIDLNLNTADTAAPGTTFVPATNLEEIAVNIHNESNIALAISDELFPDGVDPTAKEVSKVSAIPAPTYVARGYTGKPNKGGEARPKLNPEDAKRLKNEQFSRAVAKQQWAGLEAIKGKLTLKPSTTSKYKGKKK